MSLLINEKINKNESPFIIKQKGSSGGISFPNKKYVFNYFKYYKNKIKLINIEKKENQTIYYIKSLFKNSINKNMLDIRKIKNNLEE